MARTFTTCPAQENITFSVDGVTPIAADHEPGPPAGHIGLLSVSGGEVEGGLTLTLGPLKRSLG